VTRNKSGYWSGNDDDSDNDIDTSDIPELGEEFFKNAIPTLLGENLIEKVRAGGKGGTTRVDYVYVGYSNQAGCVVEIVCKTRQSACAVRNRNSLQGKVWRREFEGDRVVGCTDVTREEKGV